MEHIEQATAAPGERRRLAIETAVRQAIKRHSGEEFTQGLPDILASAVLAYFAEGEA